MKTRLCSTLLLCALLCSVIACRAEPTLVSDTPPEPEASVPAPTATQPAPTHTPEPTPTSTAQPVPVLAPEFEPSRMLLAASSWARASPALEVTLWTDKVERVG